MKALPLACSKLLQHGKRAQGELKPTFSSSGPEVARQFHSFILLRITPVVSPKLG